MGTHHACLFALGVLTAASLERLRLRARLNKPAAGLFSGRRIPCWWTVLRHFEAGRIEEGVRLTLEGLKGAATTQENAAGHSNACAGHVLLKQWAEALNQCNAALEIDTSNWRIYNNRAAIYVEKVCTTRNA